MQCTYIALIHSSSKRLHYYPDRPFDFPFYEPYIDTCTHFIHLVTSDNDNTSS